MPKKSYDSQSYPQEGEPIVRSPETGPQNIEQLYNNTIKIARNARDGALKFLRPTLERLGIGSHGTQLSVEETAEAMDSAESFTPQQIEDFLYNDVWGTACLGVLKDGNYEGGWRLVSECERVLGDRVIKVSPQELPDAQSQPLVMVTDDTEWGKERRQRLLHERAPHARLVLASETLSDDELFAQLGAAMVRRLKVLEDVPFGEDATPLCPRGLVEASAKYYSQLLRQKHQSGEPHGE